MLPKIQTVKLTQKNMHTDTCIIYTQTHAHNLPHTYMPTAVRSGRAMEPVAMIETCLFKLEPCDMAISAGLHSNS